MNRLKMYTPSELKASGWLKRQLEIQAESLSGNLDKIWPDIRDSRWIGGTCEGWERVPYWLDGFIPLAYLLEDKDKIDRAKRYIDAILAGQKEDGWICPCTEEERAAYDMWALFLIDKVLMLYYDCSGDERIPLAVYRSLKNLKEHIEVYPIFDWAHSRWFECLIPIFAVHEIYHEEWLLDLARLLKKQGLDYEALYTDWPYEEPKNKWEQTSHVVNQGMAIKAGGLSSVLENGEADDSFSSFMLDKLFTFHGTAVGHFTGDECLSGTSPIQGTELCGVAEAMYSYEVLYAFTKNPIWADRLEKLAYNAFPATISPDMWSHQYDQMTNQIACVRMDKPIFRTNNGESHLYGLEPNYGCCTANFNQGWPKFALSTFMKSEDGVAVCALAPAVLNTEINGKAVRIEADTLYPFGDVVNYIVTAEDEVNFTLTLRIPSFVASAEVDGAAAEPNSTLSLKRSWKGTSVVKLTLHYDIEIIDRPTGLKAVERGPLVYALAMGEDWQKIEYVRDNVERQFPYCDWEVRPTTDWQYALAHTSSENIEVHDTGVIGEFPFAPDTAAVSLEVPVYPINWGTEPDYPLVARREPLSTVPTGPMEKVKFIPYGCTNIRITELPVAEKA